MQPSGSGGQETGGHTNCGGALVCGGGGALVTGGGALVDTTGVGVGGTGFSLAKGFSSIGPPVAGAEVVGVMFSQPIGFSPD